nr:hypothetical protein [uncultured Desulfobacter sp.]
MQRQRSCWTIFQNYFPDSQHFLGEGTKSGFPLILKTAVDHRLSFLFLRQKDIKLIKKIFEDSALKLCLFILVINTNLWASDLLKIKVEQVRHLQPAEEISLKEKNSETMADQFKPGLHCFNSKSA